MHNLSHEIPGMSMLTDMNRFLVILCLFGFVILGTQNAQIASVTVALNPPDLLITGASASINWTVEQPNTPQNFDLTFFRSCANGSQVLKSVQPNNAPNSNGTSATTSGTFIVGLCAGDRVENFINIIAREVTSPGLEQSNTVTVLSDTVPPDPPNLDPDSEALGGATIFTQTFQITGNVDNSNPPGNATDKPETAGSVTIYSVDGLNPDGTENRIVLGGGLIQPNANFIATVDLSTFAFGEARALFIIATDPLGQSSTPKSIGQITRGQGGTATLENLSITPSPGSITNHTGVLVQGSVSGAVPPFAVKFYVNGFLNSEIGGLVSGENFAHTLNLTKEGTNCISAEIENSNTPIFKAGKQEIGCIELDLTPPPAPLVLSPPPNLTLTTKGPTLNLRVLVEADKNLNNTLFPKLFLSGPGGISFNPISPIEITTGAGEQNIIVNIQDLPDGQHTVELKAQDEVGNTSPESIARFAFIKDTQSPIVEQVRVNDIVAPQQNPPIFAKSSGVQIKIQLNEASVSTPDLRVQPANGSEVSLGLFDFDASRKIFIYSLGVTTGLDGPVKIRVQGGSDQAGNTIDFQLDRAFFVDTLAPSVAQMIPESGSVLSQSPQQIRLVFEDPLPAGAELNSGVQVSSAQITLKDSRNTQVPINIVEFDPVTVDIIPQSPLNVEGNYQVETFITDKAGNTSSKDTRFFAMDFTAINQDDIVCFPLDEGFARFGADPFGEDAHFVRINVNHPELDASKSTLNLKNLREIPQLLPGAVSFDQAIGEVRYTLKTKLPADTSKDGKYLMEAQVFDQAGNRTDKTCTFIYDNCAPSVGTIFPSTNGIVGSNLKHVSAVVQDCVPRFDVEVSDVDTTRSEMKVFRVPANGAPQEVRSRVRYETVPESRAQKLLLEFIDTEGSPVNLTPDGQYRLDIQVLDKSGNASEVSSTFFTVDTQTPLLETTRLKDGQILGGGVYYLTGRVRDADSGAGMDKVQIRVQSLISGAPSTTLLDFTAITMAGLPLPPFNPDPPWHDFSHELRINVNQDTDARITLRATDRAGNSNDFYFNVKLLANGLKAPDLSRPVSGFSTTSYFVDFSWENLVDAASYEVELITPAGNSKKVLSTTPYTRINLASYSEGEGVYRWNVRAIDSLGNVGPKSNNSNLKVDQTSPKVISVQIQDPSPESQGAITAGQSRFLITFSEAVNTSKTPKVWLRPVDAGGFTPVELNLLSFQETTALAQIKIEAPTPGSKAPQGLARISLENVEDLATNKLAAIEGGISLFEIQPGPLFDVKFFVNPVDKNSLTLAIKAFAANSGLALELPHEPAVTAISTQGDEVGLTLTRITAAAFATNLNLSTMGYNSFYLNIAGTDKFGNTNSRSIFLPINSIHASKASVLQHSLLRIEVPAHATTTDQSILMLDPDLMVIPRAQSLVHFTDLPSSPSSVTLSRPSILRGSIPATASSTVLSSNSILLVQNNGVWEFASRVRPINQTEFEASTRLLGPMAIFHDPYLPTVENLPLKGDILNFAVEDLGSGVDPDALYFHDASGSWKADYDSSTGMARIQVPKSVSQVDGYLSVEDRAGNRIQSPNLSVAVARNFAMHPQVYPNPAKNSLYLRILANFPPDSAEMKIYDSAGKLVNSLPLDVQGPRDAHRWDLRDRHGREVANGVYFMRLKVQVQSQEHREDLKFAVLR